MEDILLNVSPRMERAINLMNDEEFDHANDVLNQELDEQPNNSAVYWLQLLAQRQCNSEDMLIHRGIPFSNERSYNYACRYATAEQKEHYEKVAKKTLFFTHSNVLQCAAKNDVFRMNKWIGHYAANSSSDDPFLEVHTLLAKAGGLANPGEFSLGIIAVLHTLYQQVTEDVDTTDVLKALGEMFAAFSKLFAQKAVEAATVSLKDIDFDVDANKADATLRKRAAALLKENNDILCWVDPAGAWEKWGGKLLLPDTLPDGSTTNVKERLAAFVKQLWGADGQWVVARYAVVDAIYDQLGDEEARKAFHEAVLKRADVTAQELQYLALRSQKSSEAAWKLVKVLSNNLTVALPPLDIKKKVDNFLKKQLENGEERTAILALIKEKREWALTLENQVLEPLAPWAKRAVQAENSPYQAEWDSFNEALRQTVAAYVTTCDETEEAVNRAVADFDNEVQTSSERSGKTAAIISGVTLGIAVAAFAVCVYWLLAPQQVIMHSIYWLYGCLLGGWCVLRPILTAIQKAQKESRRLRKKAKSDKAQYTSACRKFTNWAPRFTNITFLLSVAVCLWSLLTFNTHIGVIPLADADDFALLNTNPLGHYRLEADVNAEDKALPSVKFFFGEIDGNGYTLSNVATTDTPWIVQNFGKLHHLTFQGGTWQQALVKNNRSKMMDISVSDVARSFDEVLQQAFEVGVLAQKNTKKGLLANCRITDGAVTVVSEQFVQPKKFLFGAFAAQNNGEVVNCHTNTAVTFELGWLTGVNAPRYALGGLVGRNDGTLDGSSYTGKFNVTVNDKSETHGALVYVGGLVGENGSATRSFFNGELAVNVTADNEADGQTVCSIGAIGGQSAMKNAYAQGKLSVVCRDSEEKTILSHVGALTGTIYADDVIENSYHSLACSVKTTDSKKKTTTCDYCIVAGYKPQYSTSPDVVNSFVYGTKRAAKSCGQEDLVTENSYKSASIFPNGKNLKPAKTMTTTAFLAKTLGWSDEIWEMTNGKLPTLKPVVYSEETVSDDTATTTTQQEEAK